VSAPEESEGATPEEGANPDPHEAIEPDPPGGDPAEEPLEKPAQLREDTAEGREVSREQISLTRRLRDPRTNVSIVLPIIILALI
jgi:hypothetical protein